MGDTGSFLDPRRPLEQRRQAVENLFDFLFRGGIADITKMPSDVLDEGRKRTLHRYHPADVEQRGLPVLMVPPLGSQATCFDLRRGCSMTEHFVEGGRPTYMVDYGEISLGDRDLGIDFWINEVVPSAIRTVSQDAGGAPVHLVGWCLGGLLSLGTAAAHLELPIQSIAMVASPFDISKNPMVTPVAKIGALTGGNLMGTVMKALGGIPADVVGAAFKATSLPTYVKKPVTIFKRRDDREFLAHVEAVDELMNNMYTYPGKAVMQLYRQLGMRNELATGRIKGPNREIDLADIRLPVMNIAGAADVLVPVDVAHHVGDILPNAPEVRLEVAPGGHLGVLTGRSARETTWRMIDEFLDAHTAAA